jgi:hypothetical protein
VVFTGVCAGKAVFGLVVSENRTTSLVFSPFGEGYPCDADDDRGTENNPSDNPSYADSVCRLRLRRKDGSRLG